VSHSVLRPTFLLLTCEHGGRDVPAEYEACFRNAGAVLATHRGYDIGALGVAFRIAARLSVPIVFSTTTRLLIDLNRSTDHPDLFSEFTRDLPEAQRSRVKTQFYEPYRRRIEQLVHASIAGGQVVLHVGVHSCVDVLRGQVRDLDIALLFDPRCAHEAALCDRWIEALSRRNPGLRYRRNEPYHGADDGLTTTLRARYPAAHYLGIEIELRQGMILERPDQVAAGDLIADALGSMMSEPHGSTGEAATA